MKTACLTANGKLLSAVSSIHGPIVFVLYFILYGPVYGQLVRDWSEHENFSYGFIIPIISLSLIWQKRRSLRTLPVKSSPWGILTLLASVLIGLTGKAIGEPILIRVSLVLSLGGIVHVLWGRDVLRALAFPIAYLFLMIPPPYVIVKQISIYLKTFDATVAAGLLQLIGVPVYRDTYFLHLPNITLEVADVCSGIASLFAMVSLGIIFVYYLPIRKGAKAVLLLCVIVFPVLANLLRIVLTSVSVYYWGAVMLKAFFHSFTGMFTFLLSLILLILSGECLRRKYPITVSGRLSEHGRRTLVYDYQTGPSSESKASPYLRSPSWLAAVTVLTLGIHISNGLEAGEPVPLQRSLKSIPSQLGPYRVSKKSWMGSYNDPSAESAISHVYEGLQGDVYEVFVGYSGSQTGKRRLGSPKLRLPEGWDYAYDGNLTIPVGLGEAFEASWLLARQATERRIVVYWYQAGGRTFSGEWDRRFNVTKRLLLHNRSDGAIVRIATPVMLHEESDQARKRVYNIAALVHGEVGRIVPK